MRYASAVVRAACALLWVLAGCYEPQPQVGLPCSPSGDCPAGQQCAPDGTCQLPGFEIDGGGGQVDGAPRPPDAAPIPLEPWFVSFQHPSLARASDIARVGGGYALVGSRLVVVVDPRGQIRWQKSIGPSASAVTRVTGGMVVAGSSYPHMAAIALDHDGAIQWQKRYADQESSSATDVVAMPGTDDVVLVGNSYDAESRSSPWLVRVDGAGDIVWQRRFTMTGEARVAGGTPTGDGGFVAIGVRSGATLQQRDLIVFKVNRTGDLVWQRRISGGDNEWGTDVAEGPDRELLLIGGTWSNSFGAADLWLLRLDRDGNIEAQHRIGTTSQDTGIRVFPTGSGGALVVGETGEAGNTDIYLAEIKNGVIASQRRVGSPRGDYGGKAAYGDGGVVVFGDTDAFDAAIGFFAASVRLPDGITAGCPHDSAASAQMATSSATAFDLTLTAVPTTATVTDLDAALTDASLSRTAECE
jgi:outer membrane protein assembly factor BamB